MKLVDGIPVFGEHDENTLNQLRDVASRAVRAALMADGHLGYIMPVGGVAAYDNKVSVNGVGYDIACGNAAIRTDLKAEQIRPYLSSYANAIQTTISFGLGRTNQADDAPEDHPLFEDPAWEGIPNKVEREAIRQKARKQLGTVGSGNHYVDVFEDENGDVWVGVHFGSRGFGWNVAAGFMALGQNLPWGARAPEQETLLDLSGSLGDAYWSLMSLAGQYAYAGREWVARKVVKLLGGQELELVHNHHNFAWKEEQLVDESLDMPRFPNARVTYSKELVVVRKGATPAWPKQKGFVGGSMGDNAVIVEGNETYEHNIVEQYSSFFSTVHGAGRVLSRSAAIKGAPVVGPDGKFTGQRDKSTMVTRQMMSEWTKAKGVVVRGGGPDESPHVYRRLPEVLAAQGQTIRILHTLRPLVVVMAGENDRDPYKD